ncbi:DUF371 domain-containing protein [Methanofollis aquaemaris]|uniref:DUF371 domain-containing protein n=1 Tax=Methanofollis aquaemaris TaxID=126734 RepID=A0A8A3S4X9_9EURY|nr:DUF371 domain-containing protein [Methanofollis aquaemaris]QSZ66750.1 DUF371 domain-containing protein [Methanofollis aquaemaris]
MKARDIIHCRGHPNVQALHPTTFEVTTAPDLSLAGDCIVGVAADKGAADLDPTLKSILADDRAEVTVRLRAGEVEVIVHARGSAGLALDHPADLVWRRSSFVCGRTAAVGSDTVAKTIDRRLVALLQEGADLVVEIEASIPE